MRNSFTVIRSVFLFILLCLMPHAAHAQDYAYGKPEEMRGLKKIFVDTGPDMKNRERIMKALTESKLGFELLDSAEGAEIVLMFKAGMDRKTIGVPSARGTTIAQPDFLTGVGFVLLPGQSGKPRLVMSFEDVQETVFEKKPVTNFVRDFIKAYKKANGVK
jgi:hypothetical protein